MKKQIKKLHLLTEKIQLLTEDKLGAVDGGSQSNNGCSGTRTGSMAPTRCLACQQ